MKSKDPKFSANSHPASDSSQPPRFQPVPKPAQTVEAKPRRKRRK